MSISLLLFTSVVFSVAGLPSCFSADRQFEKCRLPLTCGSGPKVFPNSTNTTYPFWGINKPKYCGQSPFMLSCEADQNLTLAIGDHKFRVISANLENHTITVADGSLLDGDCPKFWNFSGKGQFTLNTATEKIGVYTGCHGHGLPSISCSEENPITYYVLRPSDFPQGCIRVAEIPMLKSVKYELLGSNSNLSLKEALRKGFDLRYTIEDRICKYCSNSGGICGSESGSETFRCLCTDRPHNSSCTDNHG